MDRHQRVAQLWNWLPAFRAVAETEHLPSAAAAMHVTPPALSRTLRLLEEGLGKQLFLRTGRRLQLNDDGRVLLSHVRDALRTVDDGIQSVTRGSGVVRIAVAGVAAYVHAPRLLGSITRSHPNLVLEISTFRADTVTDSLLQGRLDLAVSSRAVHAPGLVIERLGEETNGVYCGPGHPLWRTDQVDLDTVTRHPFAAPGPGPDGVPLEGWPIEIERRVAMVLDRMALGLEACAHAGMLAVLPDSFVEADSREFFRLPLDVVPPTPVFLLRRRPLNNAGFVDGFVELVREVIQGGGAGERRRA